jgi:hypothetical protein
VERSVEGWAAFETARDSRWAAAAKTTGVDVSGRRKSVAAAAGFSGGGGGGGGGGAGAEERFSDEQRKLFRLQRQKSKVRKRKAKKDALDVNGGAPAWMARDDDDGRGGEGGTNVESGGGGGAGSFLGSSSAGGGGGPLSASSKKQRLLKPKPGDQHVSSAHGPLAGRPGRGNSGDRSEGEDALAAWKKYRQTLG